MRSFLSIYLGAGVRYLYFRYIRRNKKSFKTILNGDGKDSDRDFRERLKNSICGFLFLLAVIAIIVIIGKIIR
jgi:hypothetical protein